MPFKWDSTTRPFVTTDDREPARFELQQVDDDKFALLTPFRYVPAGGGSVIDVTPEQLGLTDLASIPRFMGWYASRHGRHTPAALLHDQLVSSNPPVMSRAEADAVLEEALDALDVPPLRRTMMYAAVSAATRWRSGGSARLGLVLWGLASVAGNVSLAYGVVTGKPKVIAIALLAPGAAGILWGRQYRAGVVAGYSLWFVLMPSVSGYSSYRWLEKTEAALLWARKLVPRNEGRPLPTPVPFHER